MDGDLIEIPVDPEARYPLGRRGVWHDPRNRLHRALDQVALEPRNRTWNTSHVFLQDRSYCAAETAVGVSVTSPFAKPFKQWWPNYDTEEKRFQLYRRAQTIDPFPGEDPESEGTSTDAPFKILRNEGAISAWKWLFGVEECREWAMHYGPFGVGTNWLESMWEVGKDGYLNVDAATPIAGGHAWRIIGYSHSRKAFRMVNSWGKTWGDRGRAWVHYDSLDYLLQSQGEAVTVI